MRISRTFLRSALTSLFTTGLDFLTLVTAVELFHVNYVVATWLGTVVATTWRIWSSSLVLAMTMARTNSALRLES